MQFQKSTTLYILGIENNLVDEPRDEDKKAHLNVQLQNKVNATRSAVDNNSSPKEISCKDNPNYGSRHMLPDILQQVVQEPVSSRTNVLHSNLNKTNSSSSTTDPPPKPSRTFATPPNISHQYKDSFVNNNAGLDSKNENHNNSTSSHELYLSCLDNNTSGETEEDTRNKNPGAGKIDFSRSVSHDPKMISATHLAPSRTNEMMANSFEGSPLAASSPKDTYMDSTNNMAASNPPTVPPRRSSFTNAISAGNDQTQKADGVKLTEEEVTKLYQDMNPLERLKHDRAIREQRARETNLVQDMILNRYLFI